LHTIQRQEYVSQDLKTRRPQRPLRYVEKKIRTEVDFTLAYVVDEGKKLGMAMPLSSKLLEIFRELEAGKRQFGQQNYSELISVR